VKDTTHFGRVEAAAHDVHRAHSSSDLQRHQIEPTVTFMQLEPGGKAGGFKDKRTRGNPAGAVKSERQLQQ
jgi:hypothetical protein